MNRAVVTGIGIVAPTGIGADDHWEAMLTARSAITTIRRFDASGYPVRLAGQVRDFTAADRISSRLIPQTDHWTHLGLAAAELALADAGTDPSGFLEYEMAVVTSSSSGGTEFGQREIEGLWNRGPGHVGAYQSIAWFYAATTGQISIRYGMRGPCGVIATEQAGGLDAMAHGRRLIRGGARLVITGGTDASLCPYGLVAQLSNGRLSQRDDPIRGYVPFDAEACGYLPGEGGAMLVLERADTFHQRAKGRLPYGEVVGYAATFDPSPDSGRPPTLRGAIMGALADAECRPSDIDVVFADAAGVPELDRIEARALVDLFGAYGVPVTAPKTMTGRLYAGGAALDVATALIAMRAGVIPPTSGVDQLAKDVALDLVVEPRQATMRSALIVARGWGGFNSALVVTRADRRTKAEGERQ
jgi:act minimal PKS chain-length factor (CLF/KS beta)